MGRFSDALVLDKPQGRLVPVLDRDVEDETALATYRRVADEVGVSPAGLVIEELRVWLAKKDIPTFKLAEVVPYMDDVAARDNKTGYGWHWCPVRSRDVMADVTFGRACVFDATQMLTGGFAGIALPTPVVSITNGGMAYNGPPGGSMWTPYPMNASQAMNALQAQRAMNALHAKQQGGTTLSKFDQLAIDVGLRKAPAPPPPAPIVQRPGVTPASDYYDGKQAIYARTIPLHALEKIALVEREFGAGKVKFLVSDYTVRPDVVINPDPFLMVVVPNPELRAGQGRFVIDVWDEPGFGIARMVK
jgi:hypothetical protein